jgi:hypothetical protein
MAHTLLYTLGYNAPQDSLVPEGYDWKDEAALQEALGKLTEALRPWTLDFHVAQNDGTVKGSGSHDKTGHHCLASDLNGKLDIPHDAGHWLRDEKGQVTKTFRHICWDGCMFPNEVMMKPQTWNDILAVMIAVRDRHGWREAEAKKPAAPKPVIQVVAPKTREPVVAKPAAPVPTPQPAAPPRAVKKAAKPALPKVTPRKKAVKKLRAGAAKPAKKARKLNVTKKTRRPARKSTAKRIRKPGKRR